MPRPAISRPRRSAFGRWAGRGFLAGILAVSASAAPPAAVPVTALSYADLADLADNAPLVLKARIRKVAELDAAHSAGVRPGWARIYVEATTESLFAGPAAIGESVRYLADVRRDSRGKLPKLAKQPVLVFARAVPRRPGELQLVAPDSQVAWDADTESRLRGVLREIYAEHAPGRVSRVHEAIHVAGNLAGEGETQIFLATPDGEPATITVLRHPGLPVHWTVSFSEVVESTGLAPTRESLGWYRLACFLPATLPPGVNVSSSASERAQAVEDYRAVMADLGPCLRTRGQ